MNNENTKTGLIGFFDILGYRNLLLRNEPETIAKNVLPILTDIGETVTKDLKDLHQGLNIADSSKKILDAMKWLVFSDTVLLTLPSDPLDSDPNLINAWWATFLVAARALQIKLFRAGLPTRGAVEHGEFFIKDTCFAGRAIVTACELCSQIELAACVLCKEAEEELRRVARPSLYGNFIVEYLVPMKSGEKHLLAVVAPTHGVDDALDIHRDVMRAFWGNRKDISLNARLKAQNTEQWLEFLAYELERE